MMRNSMVECQTVNLKVVGSSPTASAFSNENMYIL
jgi:hypothetical protein